MEPDVTITATPIHTPVPPRYILYKAVMVIDIIVGIGPKKSPEFNRRIERVSKVSPGTNTHGVIINTTPIAPMAMPSKCLYTLLMNPSCFLHTRSYNKLNATRIAMFCTNPNIIESFICRCNLLSGNKSTNKY